MTEWTDDLDELKSKLRLLEDLGMVHRLRTDIFVSLARVHARGSEAKAFWKTWNQNSLELRMKFRDWIKESRQAAEGFKIKMKEMNSEDEA